MLLDGKEMIRIWILEEGLPPVRTLPPVSLRIRVVVWTRIGSRGGVSLSPLEKFGNLFLISFLLDSFLLSFSFSCLSVWLTTGGFLLSSLPYPFEDEDH